MKIISRKCRHKNERELRVGREQAYLEPGKAQD